MKDILIECFVDKILTKSYTLLDVDDKGIKLDKDGHVCSAGDIMVEFRPLDAQE
jgi:hypothetical protein